MSTASLKSMWITGVWKYMRHEWLLIDQIVRFCYDGRKWSRIAWHTVSESMTLYELIGQNKLTPDEEASDSNWLLMLMMMIMIIMMNNTIIIMTLSWRSWICCRISRCSISRWVFRGYLATSRCRYYHSWCHVYLDDLSHNRTGNTSTLLLC